MGKKRASPGADTEKSPLGDLELSEAQNERLSNIAEESDRVDIALGMRRLPAKAYCAASNIESGSNRIFHAGEVRSFPGEATWSFEDHPQVLACCSVKPPRCRDTRRAPPRPGRSGLS